MKARQQRVYRRSRMTPAAGNNRSRSSSNGSLASLQFKCTECEKDGKLQRNAGGAAVVSRGAESSIRGSIGQGQTLPAGARSFMESRIGADFSSVSIHDDAGAHQLNRQLGAQAFTVGRDVYFGEGKYAPETSFGRHLLAHELTHVVQQGQAGRGKLQRLVDPARVNAARCRTCISRNAAGRCNFNVNINEDHFVNILTAADSRAMDLALRAHHLLTLRRLTFGTSQYDPTDTLTVQIRGFLLNRFRLDIENRAHHRRIRLIENRFLRVGRLLQSGNIRYRCGCDHRNVWGESISGRNTIWICDRFLDNSDALERALTLLHEPFHILYAGIGHRGTLNNIFSYEDFAADLE